MHKIAITGGAGFVGTNLTLALLRRNYEVIVVDDFSTGLRSNFESVDCEVKEVSLLDYMELQKTLSDCSYVFHLGARGSVPRSLRNPVATFQVNSVGTLNVLECVRRTGAAVAFSSSSSVYGSNLDMPKNENSWLAPITPYAASKLTGESLINSYANSFGISAITFRFFNIFGPWQRPDHDYAAVIPKWIWKIMHGEAIEVFGDGSQSRDFTYIDTVIEVLISGMERNINHPRPINLAFGSTITLNEVIRELRNSFPQLKICQLPERFGDIQKSQNDPALLKEVFPEIVPMKFDEALDCTIDWFRNFGTRIANGPQVMD